MAVKIRLKRMGKIRAPYYRVVVADSRTKRDGRAIEEIGKYHPTEEPSLIDINSERALYWLGVGAQPTEQVEALLKVTGDWQKHHGLPGTEGTLRFKAPKPDRKALYESAMRESGGEPTTSATTPRAKKAKAAAAPDPAVAAVAEAAVPVAAAPEAAVPGAAAPEAAVPDAAPAVAPSETTAAEAAPATVDQEAPVAEAKADSETGTA